MQWEDEGLVLCLRTHGEKSKILTLFTPTQGRHLGLFRPQKGDVTEMGLKVEAKWSARLPEHLGQYRCNLKPGEAKKLSHLLNDRIKLSMIASCCSLLDQTLSERLPMTSLYHVTKHFFDNIEQAKIEDYIRWEVEYLKEMGFGLDFTTCAVTGGVEGLTHVSPKTGRSVCYEEAQPYLDKLLELPAFFKSNVAPDREQIRQGFAITTHFIEKFLFHAHVKKAPEARSRLLELF